MGGDKGMRTKKNKCGGEKKSSGNSVSGHGRKVEGADVAVRLTDESRGINIDAEGSAVAKKKALSQRESGPCAAIGDQLQKIQVGVKSTICKIIFKVINCHIL